MSTISKTVKYCCTCQHFGGKATLKGSIVEYDNTSHVCKIGARGVGNVHPVLGGKSAEIESRFKSV